MKMEASVDPQCRGPDWMPITPKTGSLFHAETHNDLRRRDVITLLGGAAAALPLAARAQQTSVPVIGFLHPASAELEGFAPQLSAFHRGLGELDFVEGRNLSIEYRWANDR